jgi:3-oxoacyl-[acyl-carrier protein] reductase
MRILITGGASEIAEAIAKRRFAAGDEIIITASSQTSLDKVMANYKKIEIPVEGFVFDLENPTAAESSLEKILSKRLDALILNAASRIPKLKRFVDIDYADGVQYLQQNIEGNVWLLQKVLKSMEQNQFGRLVFISSVSVIQGTSRYPYYCAAKAAIEGLFLNLAVDYGEFDIYCNIVRPGIIATERNRRFWKRSNFMDRIEQITPSKKLGQPSQVAEAMDPLLSASSFINGSVFTVSGGLPMMRSAGLLGV